MDMKSQNLKTFSQDCGATSRTNTFINRLVLLVISFDFGESQTHLYNIYLFS